PLLRARLDPLSPILEEVGEGLLERDHALPAQSLLDLLPTAAQHRDVGRPEPSWILANLDEPEHRPLGQEVEDPLDRPLHARAEVVHLARRAPLEESPVAAHDVADIGKIARRLEIAHVHDRLAQSRLHLGDLLREVRGGEGLAAPRPGVIERAGAYDVHSIAL